MSQVFILSAAQGPVQLISGQPRVELVAPILNDALQKAGLAADLLQEIHWIGGDEEFWLTSLERGRPDLARFLWPPAPLLAHFVIQSAARVIENGGRSLVVIGQEAGGQALILLLASAELVESRSLKPRAQLSRLLTVNSAGDGLAGAAQAALEKSGTAAGDIQLLAASQKLGSGEAGQAFASARQVRPNGTPTADLFLLDALVSALEAEPARLGLLLSEGPQKAGLISLVERAA